MKLWRSERNALSFSNLPLVDIAVMGRVSTDMERCSDDLEWIYHWYMIDIWIYCVYCTPTSRQSNWLHQLIGLVHWWIDWLIWIELVNNIYLGSVTMSSLFGDHLVTRPQRSHGFRTECKYFWGTYSYYMILHVSFVSFNEGRTCLNCLENWSHAENRQIFNSLYDKLVDLLQSALKTRVREDVCPVSSAYMHIESFFYLLL